MAETPNLKIRIVPTFDGLPTIMQPIIDQAAVISVVSEVVQEIWAARAKHGKQHDLPLGYGAPVGNLLADIAAQARGSGQAEARKVVYCDNDELEQYAKAACDADPSWAKITFEEFTEALAAPTPEETRAELIQLAAMAVGAVLAHDAQR